MKKTYIILALLVFLTGILPAQAAEKTAEAEFRKLAKTYTLRPDGSQELRVQKELVLYTHTAMNRTYGETFVTYDPRWQQVKINRSYTRQKDGTVINTPANAFVEVLPQAAADAPAYNALKELVIVHTGLELGSTIFLDYTITSRPGYLPALDVYCPVKELSPVDVFTCTINVPEDKPLHYHLWNAAAQPVVSSRDGMKSVTFTLKQVAPRPYAYPYAHSAFGRVQQVASGMMPAVTATTYADYKAALKTLAGQFSPGDEAVVKVKAEEFMAKAGGNATGTQQLIDKYVAALAAHPCGVTLEESGYRLRPASEVIRTAYGTAAELANLSYVLQKAAGLNARLLVAGLKAPADSDATGLSTVVAVADGFAAAGDGLKQMQALRDYLRVTDLQGEPYRFKAAGTEEVVRDTIDAAGEGHAPQSNGYRVLTLPDVPAVSTLYAYAANTAVTENILLPGEVAVRQETVVKVPQGQRWLSLPGTKLDNAAGSFSVQYAQDGDKLIVTRRLAIRKQLYTPGDYSSFYSLVAAWKSDGNRTVVFK